MAQKKQYPKLDFNEYDIHQRRQQWSAFTQGIGLAWYGPIVGAEVDSGTGFQEAVRHAQALKRGLSYRFGLKVKVFTEWDAPGKKCWLVFRVSACPTKVKTYDDLFNCLLSVHLFQSACEMATVCGVWLPKLKDKQDDNGFSEAALLANLINAWKVFMAGFVPAYVATELKARGLDGGLSFVTEWVRTGLKQTIPDGPAQGERRRYVEAVRKAHGLPTTTPHKTLQEAIAEELPAAVMSALQEVKCPTRLHTLMSKTDEHLQALHADTDDLSHDDDVLNPLAVFRAHGEAAVQSAIGSLYEHLTPRQQTICNLLAEDFTQSEVAKKIGVSEPTLSREVSKIKAAAQEIGLYEAS